MGSEQSPSVLHANTNLDKLLAEERRSLDHRKEYVNERIHTEQKVLYRRFLRKIRWSQLQHARYTGNKELERRLRNQDRSEFNLPKVKEDNSYKDTLERRASVMLQTGDFGPPVLARPKTAAAIRSERRATVRDTDSAAIDEVAAAAASGGLTEVLVTERKKAVRPKTAPDHLSKKKEHKSLMDFGKEETTLLDAHKLNVQKRAYPRRIRALASDIEPLMFGELGVQEDFNEIMNKSFAGMNTRRPGFEPFDTTFTSPDERRRCEGNLHIRPATMHSLTRLPPRASQPRPYTARN